jgi:hypothetical protein
MTNKSSHPRKLRFRPIWLAYLGLIGLLGSLHPVLEPLRFLLVFSMLYIVWLLGSLAITLLRRLAGGRPRTTQQRSDPPPPGPAARAGMAWFWLNYSVSLALAHLNPLQLTQMFAQLGGQLAATIRTRGRMADATTFRQQGAYRLPFHGTWYVYNGGVTPETSHSWDLLAQRYAYDFVVADGQRARHAPDSGDAVSDYWTYNQEILAPAEGVVRQVRDGVRDAPGVGTGWVDWLSRDFRGNFVVIQHAPHEYSLLAHLVPGSIVVAPGQRVQSGQPIGRCGNSGHSTEPHLHFQLQDHPDFYRAVSLPISFGQLMVDQQPRDEAQLTAGSFVAQR